jgi:hypothetical protein
MGIKITPRYPNLAQNIAAGTEGLAYINAYPRAHIPVLLQRRKRVL